MRHDLAWLLAGAVVTAPAAYILGVAVTRARRGWRDLIAARNTITGLFRLASGQSWRAFKAGALVAVIVVAGLWLLIAAHA